MIQLRDYQNELIEGIYQSMSKGNTKIMVVSPAGSGKSVTMSEIARRATDKGNRVLFIVHRRELVNQIKATFIANGVTWICVVLAWFKLYQTELNEVKNLLLYHLSR